MDQITEYVPQDRTEGDSFKPSENIGHLLVVKVTDHKFIESTIHKPEGGSGIIVDVCDLDTQTADVFRDVLWMNGALVDGLKRYVGRTLVIKLAYAKSPKGRDYIIAEPASSNEVGRAQAALAQGDPFAVQVGTVSSLPPTNAKPPF